MPVEVGKGAEAARGSTRSIRETDSKFLREEIAHQVRFVGLRDQAVVAQLPDVVSHGTRMAGRIQFSGSGAQDRRRLSRGMILTRSDGR